MFISKCCYPQFTFANCTPCEISQNNLHYNHLLQFIFIKTVTAFIVPFSWVPSTRNIYLSLPPELLNLNG
jgi:hypothetical protein